MSTENKIVLITEDESRFKALGWSDFEDLYTVLQDLSFHRELQLDLETTGLGSFMTERAHTMQLGVPGKQYIFDLDTIPLGDPGTFAKLVKDKLVIGHNLAFDLPYLYKAGIFPQHVYDTMLAERLLFMGLRPRPDRSAALDASLARRLNVHIEKELQSTIQHGIKSFEDILYCAADVRYLQDLRDAQQAPIEKLRLRHRLALENKFLRVLVYLEVSGIGLDADAFARWVRRIEAEDFYLEETMREEYADINWGSPKQVAEYLKETVGIEEYTEKGNLATNADVLLPYAEQHPVVKDLLRLRASNKLVSTYGRKWFYYVMPDGKIHTKYKQLVDTGRTSCGETDRTPLQIWDTSYKATKPFPNMQNPVRNKEFRACFVPGPNRKLIVCDYSSQESVILADQSEDQAMLEFFRSGSGDMHSYVARLIYPELADLTDAEIKEHHADKRTLCKTAAFAIAYGGNGKTVADNLNCSVALGDFVYNRYMEVFPQLPIFFRKCFEFAWQYGYMPTDALTQGKRFFDNFKQFREVHQDKAYWERYYREKEQNTEWFTQESERLKWYFAMKSDLKKESVNTRIQGTGAVMSKLAGVYFLEWIEKKGLLGKVTLPIFVHDEWVAEAPDAIAEEVAAALQECMERAGKLCLKHLTIKAEPKICTHWEK